MQLERRNWGNPEKHAQKMEALQAKPFEILTNQVPETVIKRLSQDKQLIKALDSAKWPTDEETCERIAEKLHVGAEQLAAISKYQRGIMAEEETRH